MPRQKGDGLGRFGGRQKGTPNKDKPLKAMLREHSLSYFTPTIQEKGDDGRPTGNLVSRFDLDLRELECRDRAELEVKILKFHTPQMQSTNMDLTLTQDNRTLSDRLRRLAQGEDIPSETDDN